MNTADDLTTILRRWDEAACEQLCAEVARLAEENERLRAELVWAEEAAESWRDDALRLMEEACADGSTSPGLTLEGALVAVPAEVRA